MTTRPFRMIDVVPSATPQSGNPLAVVLDAGGVPRTPGRVVQECGVGPVPVRIADDALAFVAPPLIRSGPVDGADPAVGTGRGTVKV